MTKHISLLVKLSFLLTFAMLMSCTATDNDDYYGKQYSLSSKWTPAEIDTANTAINITELTPEERSVYLWINLARLFPQKFADYELTRFVEINPGKYEGNEYVNSLYQDLYSMNATNIVSYSSFLTEYAKEWAVLSGQNGEIGHNRPQSSREEFNNLRYRGECCHYASYEMSAQRVVMGLLIDDGVASLGHRKILLGTEKYYDAMGISTQPHKHFNYVCVLDFSKMETVNY